jgi:hypothetical protein
MHATIAAILLGLVIVPASPVITIYSAIVIAAILVGQQIQKADRWFILQQR